MDSNISISEERDYTYIVTEIIAEQSMLIGKILSLAKILDDLVTSFPLENVLDKDLAGKMIKSKDNAIDLIYKDLATISAKVEDFSRFCSILETKVFKTDEEKRYYN